MPENSGLDAVGLNAGECGLNTGECGLNAVPIRDVWILEGAEEAAFCNMTRISTKIQVNREEK